MKTWFVTTVSPNVNCRSFNGAYDQGLAAKLNDLEAKGHVIFEVASVSGGLAIISYTV